MGLRSALALFWVFHCTMLTCSSRTMLFCTGCISKHHSKQKAKVIDFVTEAIAALSWVTGHSCREGRHYPDEPPTEHTVSHLSAYQGMVPTAHNKTQSGTVCHISSA